MNRKTVFFLITFLILGLALRLYQIATQSYWLDEMFSLYIAKQAGWDSYTWDSNPFLYHFLLRHWVHLVGENEFFVRILSTLFSMGTAIIMFILGNRYAGRNFGLLCLALAVFHPVSIEYAQEARMYALFEFLAAFNLYAFVSAQKSRKFFLAWVFSLILLSLTHLFSFFIISFEIYWWFYSKRNKNIQKYFWITSAALLIGFLGVVKITGLDVAFLDWQKLRYDLTGPTTDLLSLLAVPGIGSAWVCVLLILAFFALPSVARGRLVQDNQIQFLGLTVILSLGLGVVFSVALERTFLLTRYFIYLNPFIILIYAIILKELFQAKGLPKKVAGFVSVGILISFLFTLPQIYKYKKAPWRDVANYVSHIPNNIVLTTRSQTVQTPYFERHLIPVKKWNPDPNGIDELIGYVEASRNVFIVENYWGGLTYWTDLKAAMTQRGYKINEQTFKVDQSEELYLMQIRKN